MSRNMSRNSNVDMDFAMFEGIADEVEANEREKEEFFKVEIQTSDKNRHEDVNVSQRMDSPMSQSFHIDSSSPLNLFPPNRPVSNASEYTDNLEGKQDDNQSKLDYDFNANQNHEEISYMDDPNIREYVTNNTKDENKPQYYEKPFATEKTSDEKNNNKTEEKAGKTLDTKLQHTAADVLIINHEPENKRDSASSMASSPENKKNNLEIKNRVGYSNVSSRNTSRTNSPSDSDSFLSPSPRSITDSEDEKPINKIEDDENIPTTKNNIASNDNEINTKDDSEKDDQQSTSNGEKDDNTKEVNGTKNIQEKGAENKQTMNESVKQIENSGDSASSDERQNQDVKVKNNSGDDDKNYSSIKDVNKESNTKNGNADDGDNNSIGHVSEIDMSALVIDANPDRNKDKPFEEGKANTTADGDEGKGEDAETKEQNVTDDTDAKGDFDEAGDRRYHLRELEIVSDDEYDDVNIQEIRQARVQLDAFTKNFDNFNNIISELEKEKIPEKEDENESEEKKKAIRFDFGSLEDLSIASSSRRKETPTKAIKGKLTVEVTLPTERTSEDAEQKQQDVAVVISCKSCGDAIYDEYTLPNLEEIFDNNAKICSKCYSDKTIEDNYLDKSISEDTYSLDKNMDDTFSDKNLDGSSSGKKVEKKKKKRKFKTDKERRPKTEQKSQIDRIKKEVKPKLEVGFDKEKDDAKLLEWLSEKEKAEKKKKRQERRERKERLREKKRKQKEEEERAKFAQQKMEEWNRKKQKELREKKKNISVSLKTNITKPIVHNQNKTQIHQSIELEKPTREKQNSNPNLAVPGAKKNINKLESKQQNGAKKEQPHVSPQPPISPPPFDISKENSFEQFRESYLSSNEAPKCFTCIKSFVESVIQDAVEEVERDSRVKQARLKRPKSHVHFKNDDIDTKPSVPLKPKSANHARLVRGTSASRGHRAITNDVDRRAINRRLLRSKTYDEWLTEKKQRQDMKTREQEINEYYDKLEEKLIFLEKERRKALLSVRKNNWTNEKLPDLSSKRPEPQGSEIQYKIEQ